MKIHAWFCIIAGVCFIGAGAGWTVAGDDKNDAVKNDRTQMAGTWRPVSYEKDGKKAAAEQLEKTRTTFSADGKVSVKRDGKIIIEGTITLDPAKKPKQSVGTFTEGELKGMTLGIYEIDGNNLRICYALPGKDRPTAFASEPGSGHVFVVYKREKP